MGFYWHAYPFISNEYFQIWVDDFTLKKEKHIELVTSSHLNSSLFELEHEMKLLTNFFHQHLSLMVLVHLPQDGQRELHCSVFLTAIHHQIYCFEDICVLQFRSWKVVFLQMPQKATPFIFEQIVQWVHEEIFHTRHHSTQIHSWRMRWKETVSESFWSSWASSIKYVYAQIWS